MSKLMELVEEYGRDCMLAGRTRLPVDIEDAARLFSEIRAAVQELERDAARLDWLADKDNSTGGVILPTDCVLEHIDDMRAAIDAAMEAAK